MTIHRLCAGLLLLAALPAAAGWALDNEGSRLSFVTIKAGNVGEVHSFGQLAGTVAEDGAVEVTVALASVDTLIPIRDERMRELLFNAAVFPTATVTARVNMATFSALEPGSAANAMLDATIEINDKRLPQAIDVVARLSEHKVLVVCRAPFVVHAAAAGYVESIERLREIAGLPSISQAVPVTFVLTFVRDP